MKTSFELKNPVAFLDSVYDLLGSIAVEAGETNAVINKIYSISDDAYPTSVKWFQEPVPEYTLIRCANDKFHYPHAQLGSRFAATAFELAIDCCFDVEFKLDSIYDEVDMIVQAQGKPSVPGAIPLDVKFKQIAEVIRSEFGTGFRSELRAMVEREITRAEQLLDSGWKPPRKIAHQDAHQEKKFGWNCKTAGICPALVKFGEEIVKRFEENHDVEFVLASLGREIRKANEKIATATDLPKNLRKHVGNGNFLMPPIKIKKRTRN